MLARVGKYGSCRSLANRRPLIVAMGVFRALYAEILAAGLFVGMQIEGIEIPYLISQLVSEL